jgi:hypothetical protein
MTDVTCAGRIEDISRGSAGSKCKGRGAGLATGDNEVITTTGGLDVRDRRVVGVVVTETEIPADERRLWNVCEDATESKGKDGVFSIAILVDAILIDLRGAWINSGVGVITVKLCSRPVQVVVVLVDAITVLVDAIPVYLGRSWVYRGVRIITIEVFGHAIKVRVDEVYTIAVLVNTVVYDLWCARVD